MAKYEKWFPIVKDLVAKEKDFTQDPWVVSSADISFYRDLAKTYGWKRSKTEYFGLGRAFYAFLQKVYRKMESK